MKQTGVMLLLMSGMFAANVLPSAADSMQSSSMQSSSMMAMPKCASGDQVVGMNTMTKMYMTQDQMKTKMAGLSQSQKQAMIAKNHVKMMCQSQAKAMGGTMMTRKPM